MPRSAIARIVLPIAVSACFLLAGHSLVPERTPRDPSSLAPGADTDNYILMVEGRWQSAAAPFRYRVLVPFLGSLLPFSPADSLRLISYSSLFVAYLLILKTGARLGLAMHEAVCGLLAVWASAWHLYTFYNPFMTDAFGLLALCVMTFALVSDSFALFAGAALLGVLARETTIFLVPVWATRDRRRGIMLTAAALVVVLIPRYLLASPTDPTIASMLNGIGTTYPPLIFARQVFALWGFVWVVSLIGVWYLPPDQFTRVAAAFVALLVGAFGTSLIANDTGRMFAILTPVLALASAALYAALFARHRGIGFVLIGLTLLQGLASRPDLIFTDTSEGFRLVRRLLLGAELALCASILFLLRDSLARRAREKWALVCDVTRSSADAGS